MKKLSHSNHVDMAPVTETAGGASKQQQQTKEAGQVRVVTLNHREGQQK